MKKKSPDPSDPLLELLDNLLGPVEDMSSDELTSALTEAGIDLAAARGKLYAQVSDKRSKLWEAKLDAPSDITSLLAQLRPHHLPSADPRVAQQAAASWLRDLVDRRQPIGDDIEFATAARNLDGPLTDSDQNVMRELEEKLRSKPQQESN